MKRILLRIGDHPWSVPSLWLLLPMLLAAVIDNKVSAFSLAPTRPPTQRITSLLFSTTSSTRTSSFSSSWFDLDETATRHVTTFQEWAIACGVQACAGFQLVPAETAPSDEHVDTSPPLEVGVRTSQDLPAQSPVLFVPHQMIFSALQVMQEVGPLPEAQQLLTKLDTWERDALPFYLFGRILQEFEKGKESPWFPWLNALPRYFATGASMTHFCCSNCLPPLVGNLALAERTRFRQFFKALNLVDDSILNESTRKWRELAKWAFNVVYTRSIPDGKDLKIVPMADMFNHGTVWEVQEWFDEAGNFQAFSTYDVPAGSPLRRTYTLGDSTNPSHLLARYGFLDESSPATFCKLVIDHPSPQLIEMGYEPTKMLFYKDSGEVSQEVWDVLLYQLLESIQPHDQHALYEAHRNGDDETKQRLHQQYYSETAARLLDHIDSFLRQLQDLSQRADGRDLTVHPRLPLILKHNAFVRETFWKVRSNLMNHNT